MSAFNSVKVFSASQWAHRQVLDEEITRWLEDARARRPGFQLVDIVVTQSSDADYHCLSLSVFYNEDLAAPQKGSRHG